MSVITPHNYTNDYSSTLASGYTAGGTSLSLTSATGANGLTLPTSNFVLKVEDEYFLVTSRSGTTCTVTNSYAGSTNVNHSNGAVVTGCWIVPAVLDDLRYGSRDLLNQRPYGTKGMKKYEYQNVASGASFDILPTVNGSGYIDGIWLGDISAEMGPGTWQISITIDGEGTPSINLVALENFCGSLKCPTAVNFWHPYFIKDAMSMVSFLPIPFTTSVQVTVKNISGAGQTMFSQVTYNTGVTNNFPYMQKLYCVTGSQSDVAPNTVVTFMDNDFNKKGRLAGIHWAVDTTSASNHLYPLEGNFKIYIDGSGTANLESSGSEDWFFMTNFFANATPPQLIGDTVGLLQKGNSSPYIWSAFRLHTKDPITFEDALKITWNCGDTSENSYTGNCTVYWTVWYYLET